VLIGDEGSQRCGLKLFVNELQYPARVFAPAFNRRFGGRHTRDPAMMSESFSVTSIWCRIECRPLHLFSSLIAETCVAGGTSLSSASFDRCSSRWSADNIAARFPFTSIASVETRVAHKTTWPSPKRLSESNRSGPGTNVAHLHTVP
jgi:hypothetical protein